jgi:hypothetical protein
VLFLSTAYLLLCTNDDNKLAVDAQITDPKGEVHMTLVKSMGAPPLFDRKLTHNGALNYTLPQSGLPEWPWVKADTVADGKSELLKTVAAYQQAFVKKDIAVIDAFERPYFDSVLKMQAMPPGARGRQGHPFRKAAAIGGAGRLAGGELPQRAGRSDGQESQCACDAGVT